MCAVVSEHYVPKEFNIAVNGEISKSTPRAVTLDKP